jgi:hypothetical protein
MSLKMRVAFLPFEMVQRRRRKWTEEDVKLWLADQGFDLSEKIKKRPNWKDGRFIFVQPDYDISAR